MRATWGPRRLRSDDQVNQLLQVPAPRGEDPCQTLATISKAIAVQKATLAASLDWKAMRSLHRIQTHRGWHLQLQDDGHWQQQLSKHMKGIFAKPRPACSTARILELQRQLRWKCKHTP